MRRPAHDGQNPHRLPLKASSISCLQVSHPRRRKPWKGHRWFSVVYHNPDLTTAGGVYGTPEQVREQLEELVAMGANHLLLNPVTRYTEQVEALAEVAGLS